MPISFPSLHAMICNIEAEAAREPDNVAALVAMLRLVIASDADPYMLVGALVEGIATTLEDRLPIEKQGEVAVQTMRLLLQRLRCRGVV